MIADDLNNAILLEILNPLCLPISPPGQRNHAMATPSSLRPLP